MMGLLYGFLLAALGLFLASLMVGPTAVAIGLWLFVAGAWAHRGWAKLVKRLEAKPTYQLVKVKQ
jgi:hypothetical protein